MKTLFLLAGFLSIASAAEPKPNVVMILVDDLGRQDLGCHGSTFHKTPNIDTLAKSGLVFDNAYCAHPRCVPSRYGIFSGRMPHRDGVPGFEDKSEDKNTLALKRVTFAEVMKEAGYSTGYIGKWHLGDLGSGDPSKQGFTDSRIAGEAGAPNSYFHPFHLTRNGQHKEGEKFPVVKGKDGEYLTNRLTDEAVDFLRKNKEKPFMLVLAHYAVHTPFQAPEELVDEARQELRKEGKEAGGTSTDPDFKNSDQATDKTEQNNPTYAAMVKSMDGSVGRVMKELDALGLSETTLVILTSDHGGLSTRGEKNQRPLATTNLPYRHGKGWLYDGGLRVPMIVKWPGVVKPGTTAVQTLGTDHYATILEACGLKAESKEALDSVSYLPVLKGGKQERGPMVFHSPQSRPGQTGDRDASAMVIGKWKLFQHLDDGRVELYDLEADPGENQDLSKDQPTKTTELKIMLEKIKAESRARQGGKKPFKNH
jgi:arylsulfatase A-like enzyme